MSQLKNRPTKRGRNLLRQKTLAKKIGENRGEPISKLMVASGYSPNYHSEQLTQTASWQELMDKILDDSYTVREHRRQIRAKKVMVVNKSPIKVPDNDARLKAIDMHYKLRGYYKGTQPEDNVAKTFHIIVARISSLFPDSK